MFRFADVSAPASKSEAEGYVRGELGAEWRVADWNDIRDAWDIDRDQLTRAFEARGAYLTWNGNWQWGDTDRIFLVEDHNGNKPDSFLSHDQLGEHEISLGSWSGHKRPILAFTRTISPTPTLTVKPTPGGEIDYCYPRAPGANHPPLRTPPICTPTPTPVPPTPTLTPTIHPTITASPTPTPTASPTSTPTASPTQVPTPTAPPTPTASPTPVPTPTPAPPPTSTPAPANLPQGNRQLAQSAQPAPANLPPASDGIPSQSVAATQTLVLDLPQYFSDPDGDWILDYRFSGAPPGVDAELVNGRLTIRASELAPVGTGTVYASAYDGKEWSEDVPFQMTIERQPPQTAPETPTDSPTATAAPTPPEPETAMRLPGGNCDPGNPCVDIHADRTELTLGDADVRLTLSMLNSLAQSPMTVNMVLRVPSGWAVVGEGLAETCTSQCGATYRIEPAAQRDVIFTARPNQSGSFSFVGNLEWYFGDDKNRLQGDSKNIQVVVSAANGGCNPLAAGAASPGTAAANMLFLLGPLGLTAALKVRRRRESPEDEGRRR